LSRLFSLLLIFIQDAYNTLATDSYENIFPELSESEGKSYLAQMPNHSAISLTGPLNYPAYLYIPSTVVIPEHDKIIPPKSQRKGVERAKKEGAMVTLKTVDAGHVPMLSVPDKIAEILIAAAKALS
jgi:pimeloyl-ACP methyl ester carboxylesterase